MFVCEKGYSCCDYQYWDTVEDIGQDAKECGHLIEVAQVRHGRWEVVVGSDGKEYMVCTVCRKQQDLTGVFSYCPNCGAKMDLEE